MFDFILLFIYCKNLFNFFLILVSLPCYYFYYCSGDDPNGLDESSLSDRADAAAKASSAAAGTTIGGKAAGGKENARVGTGRRAGRLDLSGAWKRVRVENYEAFLGAQGATFVQRKLASSLPLVHTFSMSKDLMAFNLTEKGGPIDSNGDFIVDGPAVPTNLAKATFLDTTTWEDGKLKVVKLRTPEKSYELRTYRWLEDDGNTIHCVRNFIYLLLYIVDIFVYISLIITI